MGAGQLGTTAKRAYKQAMGEMSFDFPPDLRRWIEERVAEGRYADAGDYVRDLIRRDQDGFHPDAEETPEYIAWVRERVAEAQAAPLIDRDPRDIIDELIAKRRTARG